jgi:hypothetical protein
MLPFLLAGIVFVFLLLGSIVFLVCLLIPWTRQYALSAALWCSDVGSLFRRGDGNRRGPGHRYVVCSPNLDTSPVLSIWEASDAIVYGRTLLEYLEKEVLSDR